MKVFNGCGFATNAKLNTNVKEIEKKVLDTGELVEKTECYTTVTDIESKIPDGTDFLKKADFDAKLRNINNKVTSNQTK